MDLKSFIDDLVARGIFTGLANNPAAQFGIPQRPYLGPTILPERQVPLNMFKESGVQYRTIIANDGGRYSPAQLKETGEMIGTMEVVLGDSDIAREFNGRDYDALLEILQREGGNGPSQEGGLALMRWVDQTVVRALVELNEKQRFDALLNAQVVRRGDNGYLETVTYPNPSGHRAAAATVWSNDANDPMNDIIAMADLLTSKGYTVNRFITSTKVMRILEGNTKIQQRFGPYRILATTEISEPMSRADMVGGFQRYGFPQPEIYDNMYRDTAGTKRFLPETVFLMVATTGRDETVVVSSGSTYLPNVAGYTAIGRPVGVPGSGRVIRLFPMEDKPPRIKVEGWQTSLPVITEPESIAVITGIS